MKRQLLLTTTLLTLGLTATKAQNPQMGVSRFVGEYGEYVLKFSKKYRVFP